MRTGIEILRGLRVSAQLRAQEETDLRFSFDYDGSEGRLTIHGGAFTLNLHLIERG